MKLFVSLCVLALASRASAQVGDAGIVDPHGNHVQFSHDFAHAYKLVGPSGIVSATGHNIQLTADQAELAAKFPSPAPSAIPAAGPSIVGDSGYLKADGTPVQFTHDQAFAKFKLKGPSGIVFSDGGNIQFRKKRSAPSVFDGITIKDNFGDSGIVKEDGTLIQFTPEQADSILLRGPSAVIFKDGSSRQLSKRSAPGVFDAISIKDNFGASGIVKEDGTLIQLSPEQADSILLKGPSAVIFKDGSSRQFRSKRSAPWRAGDVIGPSGIVRLNGAPSQFTAAEADNIVLVGPSGVVTKDGKNRQLLPRVRRSPDLIGPGGAILNQGKTQVQFKKGNAKILLEGPGGYIFDDGTLVQKH